MAWKFFTALVSLVKLLCHCYWLSFSHGLVNIADYTGNRAFCHTPSPHCRFIFPSASVSTVLSSVSDVMSLLFHLLCLTLMLPTMITLSCKVDVDMQFY